jgi:hypothetical protein
MTENMNDSLEIYDDVGNPLDSIETILHNQDWVFDRTQEDKITVHISGSNGQYQLTFTWLEEYNAVNFRCEYDLHIPKMHLNTLNRALQNINSKLPIGHFAVNEDDMAPYFSYTSLFRECVNTSDMKNLEDLIEHALTGCEQNYVLFNLLTSVGVLNDNMLDFALMDSAGAA